MRDEYMGVRARTSEPAAALSTAVDRLKNSDLRQNPSPMASFYRGSGTLRVKTHWPISEFS